MNKNLLILGAGQYGMVAKEVVESIGCFKKIDFLDDYKEIAIDKLTNYEKYVAEYPSAVVAIGNDEIRLSYIRKLEDACFRISIWVNPQAYVAPSAPIDEGDDCRTNGGYLCKRGGRCRRDCVYGRYRESQRGGRGRLSSAIRKYCCGWDGDENDEHALVL